VPVRIRLVTPISDGPKLIVVNHGAQLCQSEFIMVESCFQDYKANLPQVVKRPIITCILVIAVFGANCMGANPVALTISFLMGRS